MLNPWAQAREAQQRADQAEERAAFLEKQLDREQRAADEARESEINVLKIICNMGWQQAAGFTPFPEAAGLPVKKEPEIRGMEQVQNGMQDSRTRAHLAFKNAEMARFSAAEAEPDTEID